MFSSKLLPLMGATLLMASAALGQDPLNGQRWTFSIQATPGRTWNYSAPVKGAVAEREAPGDPAFAIVGQAVAANGTLRILATSILGGSITRLERDIGSYTINAAGTGGSIIMNLSSNPMQYDFWFFNSNRSLHLVSTVNGYGATGTAHLAPAGCPAGVTDSLAALTGSYAFQAAGVPREPFPLGIIGVFTASGVAVGRGASFLPVGGLDILATSNLTFGGSVTRLERDAGSYSVNGDCLWGTLVMNLSSNPVQFDFFFRDGFQSADMISISQRVLAVGEFNR